MNVESPLSGIEQEQLPPKYISVDIEASGPALEMLDRQTGQIRYFSMLSYGACVTHDTSLTFYKELKPISLDYVPANLQASRFTMEYLQEHGVEPATAMKEFKAWIEEVSKGHNPVCVMDGAAFDWKFVDHYEIFQTS